MQGNGAGRLRCAISTGSVVRASIGLMVMYPLLAVTAAASAADAPLPIAATLSSSDGAPGTVFPWSVAASGTTVVTGGIPSNDVGPPTGIATAGAAYVFTQPANGWMDTVQTAKLVSSGGAVAGANFGSDVAVSGGTIAVGEFDSFGMGGGSVDLFVEPVGGWAGTVTQNSVLTASDGAVLTGTVAVLGQDVFAVGAYTLKPTEPKAAVYVFAPPAGGWPATAHEVARLVGPGGSQVGGPLAVSGRTVFAGAGPVYAFDEPAGGWSGTITPSAELVTSEQLNANHAALAASGNAVALGAPEQPVPATSSMGAVYVFSEPARGWVGKISQAAKLTANSFTAIDGAGEGLGDTVGVSRGLVAATTAVTGADHDCPCQGAVYAFGEAPGGWSGTVAAEAAGTVQTAASPAAALDGQDVFLATQSPLSSGPGVVSLARPIASPTASRVAINGLANGKPQLRFALRSGGNTARVRSFIVELPHGLRFAQNLLQVERDLSIGGAHGRSLRLSRGRLIVTLTSPYATIGLRANWPALLENTQLRKLRASRRATRARNLTVRILIVDATGSTTLVTPTTN